MKAITNGRMIVPGENEAFCERTGCVLLYDAAGIRAIVDAAAFDAEAESVAPEDVLDAGGRYVAPGFWNVHVHGGSGADTMDADPAALDVLRRQQAAMGVTTFLPTTMTCPWDDVAAALGRVRAAMAKNGQGLGADILGAHLEGPFISPEEKGSQEETNILPPDVARIAPYADVVRLVTFAPEELPPRADETATADSLRPDASRPSVATVANVATMNHTSLPPDERDWSFAEACERAGITLSIGHTAADYETAASAVRSHGIHHFTHLFNAMTGLHHRRPGAVGAALDTDACVELICDDVHIAPAVQRLVWRLKGKDRLILVTDAMRACGLGDGTYEFGGHEVTVTGARALLADGTIAASVATLPHCMRCFRRNTGASVADVVTMVTQTPARDLSLYETRGSFAPGKRADITIFDDDFTIFATIVGGRRVGKMCKCLAGKASA